MKRIFIPTQTESDWQQLLADPDLHWKKGYSAMTTAACWEAAKGKLPPDVISTLKTSGKKELVGLKLLAAVPEWEVELKGGRTNSHTDVMAFATNDNGLVVIGVEAKVEEDFGPTLGEKRKKASKGQIERIDYLHEVLQQKSPLSDDIRYQLLHRTVSAIITAQEFHAATAVMLVHSFSQTGKRKADFTAFCKAMSAKYITEDLYEVKRFKKPTLYLAWCSGDKKFLKVQVDSKE